MTSPQRSIKQPAAKTIRNPRPRSVTVAVAAEDAAAYGQASNFQRVFESAYGTTGESSPLWVLHSAGSDAAHGTLLFNRRRAAELAGCPVRARVIDEWFAASGLERRKDL